MCCPKLIQINRDIFGWVRTSHNQHLFSFELPLTSEVMSMENFPSKILLTFESDIIRNSKMAISYNYMVILKGLSLFGL